MKYAARILLVAALLSAAPALAAGRGNGSGSPEREWRGDGQFQRGGPRGPGGPQGPGGPGPVPYDRSGRRPAGPEVGLGAVPPPRHGQGPLGKQGDQQQNRAFEGVRSRELRPLNKVLDDLNRRQPGRQLDSGIEDGPDGRPVYRVRWGARDGRRMDFIVDAQTGQVLSTEGQ
jgi:hypothetical protein